jgi:hypothetical protein
MRREFQLESLNGDNLGGLEVGGSIILKCNLKIQDRASECVDWIHLVQDRDQ